MSSNEQNVGNGNEVAGSLTFPVRNDGIEPLPDQPRQPRNLQGLLRFAMEATKAEDAPGSSELGPMDDERRKFLEDALKALTVDMADVIRKAIQVLIDTDKISSIHSGADLPDDVQYAFDNLLELVDDVDVANDFYKLGGFAIFPVCLSSENETVRTQACSILGECCQNNPFCQSKALECGLVNVLINLVQSENGHTLAKTIYALSCACREYPPSCAELVSQDGCSALGALLTNADLSARTKAAFFVGYLCHNCPDAKQKFIDQNIISTITKQVKTHRDHTTEHLLSIVVALLDGRNPTVIRQCTSADVNLRKVLENHINDINREDESYVEEIGYCEEIMMVLNSYRDGDLGEEIDR